jgi:transaldolase
MKPTETLHHEGQSLWLDNITRDLLTDGTLRRYIEQLGITGLTSNPTIFDQAFLHTPAYDEAIRRAAERGLSGEDIFFEIALEDLRAAADAFRPIYDRTHGLDGWVSLEVSPLLAYDAPGTLVAAIELYRRAERPNLFIKIPGTAEGLAAIEEAIFAGVPVNVTLLFDRAQYVAAAGAYLRGIERRVAAGLDPAVGSVASVFVSRWGRLANEGALPQRLLWASTGTKDEHASDVLYVRALAAPLTVNTMPEKTLIAFGDHGDVDGLLSTDTSRAEALLAEFVESGVDLDALAERLQVEAAEAFERSWQELLSNIGVKSATLTSVG